MCLSKIFFSLQGIIIHDRWGADAIGSLRGPGRLPDWQPSDHLNILKGVEKQPADDNWYTHLIKSVSGATTVQ